MQLMHISDSWKFNNISMNYWIQDLIKIIKIWYVNLLPGKLDEYLKRTNLINNIGDKTVLHAEFRSAILSFMGI